ncbi:hypothetical protein [Salibacter halophilus]|uniref:PorT family protein n=1 Tax=Salibacter halophilus TaxID=1803916 RepID=A0A6N6M2Z3_9FLAO|nr:hypothetical protein [Salibacter halophilus]KAB1063456.1 hypothetical protein F3059_10340 [Salibacter halophilus]
MVKKLLFGTVFLFSIMAAKSQVSIKDSAVFTSLIDVSYALQFPGGDMADRFGYNNNIGGGFSVKLKSNWEFGLSGSLLFGRQVKDDRMLEPFTDDQGIVLGLSGLPADIFLYERGFTVQAKVGKVIPLGFSNPNSGLLIKVGGGFMQHKIRIEDEYADVPMLNYKDNKVGFDRLSFGAMTSQFIGYRYLSDRRLINFFFGFEFMQGFTKARRDYQYDIGRPSDETRLDLLYGIRLGWTLPLYQKQPDEYYFR